MPITITVFVSGTMDAGKNSSGTHGSKGGASQRSAGAKPIRGTPSPEQNFVIDRFIRLLMDSGLARRAIKGWDQNPESRKPLFLGQNYGYD